MKKKTKNILEQGEILLILLCITFLIYIVMQFFLHYHTLDLTVNMMRIGNEINSVGTYDLNGSRMNFDFSKVTDIGSDNIERPLINYYIYSNNQIRKYFLYGLFDCLLLGFLLGRRL